MNSKERNALWKKNNKEKCNEYNKKARDKKKLKKLEELEKLKEQIDNLLTKIEDENRKK